MNSVFITIVTYNATPWLRKCLGSIDFEKYKVVVIDNKSKDNTVEIIKNEYPQVKLFEEQKNTGFGQANNIGISYALQQGAEYVFLLNQDAYLIDDVLEKLVSFQEKNPEFGIVSPIHITGDQLKLDKNFANYVRHDINPYFISDHVLKNTQKPVYEVPFVNAASWLLNKRCLMKVGGFDPIFFHYGEDDNYCQRVAFHDFKIGIIPRAYIIHDRDNRAKSVIEKYSKEYFVKQERSFKVRFANILNEDYNEFGIQKKQLQKNLLKAMLKLNFKEISGIRKLLLLMDKIELEVQQSVVTNKKSQPSYLNV